ncbi:MFS transporter [Pseudonocardiaceae bacterium YIM PH 21723]|nr:MFS transporter [Pseudonocardiaceae bacterium YIM PH 21723]
MVGTTIEFYDFYIYGTAAALVFGKQFFPALGPAAGTVAAFATFGVAFLARPFGAMLFGHFGDRLGRKRTLVSTLLLMGLSTAAIGLLPSAAAIGVFAPILLVALRILQGLAVGGEWAGAVLLTTEHAPPERRGWYGMFPQLGPSVALILSSGTYVAIDLGMSDAAFLDWGWRLPFLISSVLVLVGMYVRLKVTEPTIFTELVADGRRSSLPLLEVFREQPRQVLLTAGTLMSIFSFFYTATTFLTSYGTGTLGHSRLFVLSDGIYAGVVFGVTTLISGFYADRIGRRTVIAGAAVLSAVWGLALFPVVDTGSPLLFAVAMCVTLACMGLGYGALGAFLPEQFATRYRYTGAGMGFALGGVLGGAALPLASASLAQHFGSVAVGVYLTVTALVSLACVLGLSETRERALAEV